MCWIRFKHLFILGIVLSATIRAGDLLIQAFRVIHLEDPPWLIAWGFNIIISTFAGIIFAYFILLAYNSAMFLINSKRYELLKIRKSQQLDATGIMMNLPRKTKKFKFLWWTITRKESDDKYRDRIIYVHRKNEERKNDD